MLPSPSLTAGPVFLGSKASPGPFHSSCYCGQTAQSFFFRLTVKVFRRRQSARQNFSSASLLIGSLSSHFNVKLTSLWTAALMSQLLPISIIRGAKSQRDVWPNISVKIHCKLKLVCQTSLLFFSKKKSHTKLTKKVTLMYKYVVISQVIRSRIWTKCLFFKAISYTQECASF